VLGTFFSVAAIEQHSINQTLADCNSGNVSVCDDVSKSLQSEITNRDYLAKPVIKAANDCLTKNWCKDSDFLGKDLTLLSPELKVKLDARVEAWKAERKKAKAEIAAMRKKAAENKILKASWGDWVYGKPTDNATGKKYRTANVSSENSLYLSSPYDGEQSAYLRLRTHPRYGFDVYVQIEKGQILCDDYNNTNVLVRFDDGPAVPYSCGEPADYSSNLVFIRGGEQFEAAMKKAKMAHITLNLYQEGSKTLTFKVKGYDSSKI